MFYITFLISVPPLLCMVLISHGILRSQILKCQLFPSGIPKNNPWFGHFIPGILLYCWQLHKPNIILLVPQKFMLNELYFL